MADVDVQEIATRKLGPLPAWGWAIAIVGAVVVFKVVSGSKGSSGSTGSGGTSLGAGNTDTSNSGGDAFSGPNSLVEQLSKGIEGLNTFQVIQRKLSEAINQRASLLSTRATLQTQINGYRDSLRGCKSTACKNKYNKLIKDATAKQTTNTASLNTVNKLITDLQKQLEGTATNG